MTGRFYAVTTTPPVRKNVTRIAHEHKHTSLVMLSIWSIKCSNDDNDDVDDDNGGNLHKYASRFAPHKSYFASAIRFLHGFFSNPIR